MGENKFVPGDQGQQNFDAFDPTKQDSSYSTQPVPDISFVRTSGDRKPDITEDITGAGADQAVE